MIEEKNLGAIAAVRILVVYNGLLVLPLVERSFARDERSIRGLRIGFHPYRLRTRPQSRREGTEADSIALALGGQARFLAEVLGPLRLVSARPSWVFARPQVKCRRERPSATETKRALHFRNNRVPDNFIAKRAYPKSETKTPRSNRTKISAVLKPCRTRGAAAKRRSRTFV